MSPTPSKSSGAEKKQLPELFREAWSSALAAVSSAEDEAHRALSRVSGLSGWDPEEVRKNAQAFAERLAGQRRQVEKSMQAGVKRALARMKLPRRQEVEALRARAAELSARLEAAASKRGSTR